MSAQRNWIGQVISYVCPFVRGRWPGTSSDAVAFVSAYRVYRVPLRGAFSRRPLIADFEGVRALFIQWNAPYQKLDQNVVEKEDGGITMEPHPLNVYQTGEGVLLLLMAPLPDNYSGNDEDRAKEQITFIRSVMVALLGRNAAYEHEFDMTVECGTRTVSHPSAVFAAPVDEQPAVNKGGMELVSAALEKLSALDGSTQNRVRLSLRWYRRSFGDDRIVRNTIEEDVDQFINCWLAWETLLMERYNDHIRITRALASIHGLDLDQTAKLFPVGRIYALRGQILHSGLLDPLQAGLVRFMADVFADLLLHVLDLPSGENTRRYLDGSASELA